MSLDGIEPPEFSKRHGDLLAFGWSSPKRPTACYRITSDGIRALRLLGESDADPVPIDLPPIKRKREEPQVAECALAE